MVKIQGENTTYRTINMLKKPDVRILEREIERFWPSDSALDQRWRFCGQKAAQEDENMNRLYTKHCACKRADCVKRWRLSIAANMFSGIPSLRTATTKE